jgi:hypothetical protein
MAEATYQIQVRNRDGERVAIFVGAGRGTGGLQSLSYYKRVRTQGGSEARIDGLDERIDDLLINDSSYATSGLDFWWEFWRRDILGGVAWYRDFVVFHRHDEITQDQEGQDVYVARGSGLNVLLGSETIRADVGSAGANKSGVCETVAKEYVNEQIGPGAPAAQQRQGLTVQADAATGLAWANDRANENLADVLQELAEFTTADFMIEPTSNANDALTMDFRWYDGQYGEDRTEGNAGGLPPVILSPDLSDVTNIQFINSKLAEVNTCYVLGEGVGTLRNVVTVTTAGEAHTPWARRAVSREARSNNNAELTAEGNKVLAEQESKRGITFTVLQTPAVRYGRDWFVGDLVTVKFRGLEFTQKVMGVRVSMSSSGVETIKPELRDV